ncbi:hypothetical protein RHGRI_001685 [Rhododendron griersonianum]|uniref:Uncharacterized protein n=1 Tax=Rhododendron griersonianum TaxID=479676 RepID=A0AAV6LQ24_9ERIC|nr:hypothetical protein RHGRI_001685 [Rhododendron griersonianum]
MIKSIKNRIPHPESARNSPGNIGLNDHANSNTHQSPFEGRLGEDVGQGKMKSRLGKEKMYPEEVPQSCPVPPVQRREVPPLKKANIGQTSEPHEETKQEEFTLVKGVPDWFLKQVKPDLFQGYKSSTRNGNKTFKPPSSNSGNWFREEETLKKVASAMLEEDFDPPSPNSLASYQSGLLEAMLVEQGGMEGSSSPMEVSTQEVESKETVK